MSVYTAPLPEVHPSPLGNWNRLREKRIGIMLHYDDSTSDAGALEWLMRDPRCHVSYTWVVTDDGTVTLVAPKNARAWHAGVCKPSSPRLAYRDANSAFYGLAIAASGKDRATEQQIAAVVALCRDVFREHKWPLTDGWRVTTHAREAWPRGRKVDCEGADAHGRLRTKDYVLDPDVIRARLVDTSSPTEVP